MPGEERGQRLYDALAAYDEALRHYRPDTAPLDYAATQNNRANRLSELATLPGEDRRQRLTQALRCAAEAVVLFEQYQQAQYLAVGRRVLGDLRRACGDDFADLWAAAGLGEPPDWLEDGADEDEARPTLADLIPVFSQIQNAEQMVAFWQAMPTEMEEPFIQAVEAFIAQVEAAGEGETVKALRSRLEGFRQIREAAAAQAISPEARGALAALAERVQAYMARLQAADAENPQVAEWQAITELGEALLAAQGQAPALLDWAVLQEQIASDFNTLGNAHDDAGDKTASLAAYERAIALQPGFAMFHRNRASTLIALGRLDEARVALDQARSLEPDAPRLAQLQAALAKAQEGGGE